MVRHGCLAVPPIAVPDEVLHHWLCPTRRRNRLRSGAKTASRRPVPAKPPEQELGNSHYLVRTMTQADLDLAIDWAAAEGWNPGLGDGACFLAQDPEGFVVGELDGQPIASISVVRYGADFGFLGFYICVPERRGQGYGLELWRQASQRLDGRVVGLDGVVAQQHNYARSGYVLAHRNVRLGGYPAVKAPTAAGLVDLGSVPFGLLSNFDRMHFGTSREAFLRCWAKPEKRSGLALMRDGALAGYGVVRQCRDGWKIGPLFAENESDADLMFRGLAARTNGQTVFLDIPDPNKAAWRLTERHGLTPSFETARMYRGPAPELPLDRIFGITTFELG